GRAGEDEDHATAPPRPVPEGVEVVATDGVGTPRGERDLVSGDGERGGWLQPLDDLSSQLAVAAQGRVLGQLVPEKQQENDEAESEGDPVVVEQTGVPEPVRFPQLEYGDRGERCPSRPTPVG